MASGLNRPNDNEDGQLPPWGVRTAISFLLFVQLFIVGVAVLGNFGIHSGLEERLVSTPGINQYLNLLHLNTSYNFHLVSGMADDWDHDVVLLRDVPADLEATPTDLKDFKTLALMPSDMRPGIRRQRYLTLAADLAQGEDDTERNAFLADALAKGMLRNAGMKPDAADGASTRHRLVCREIQTQELTGNANLSAEQRNPLAPRWINNVFEANIVPGGAVWVVTKVVGRGEATHRRPSQRTGTPDQSPASDDSNPETKPTAPKDGTKASDASGAKGSTPGRDQ